MLRPSRHSSARPCAPSTRDQPIHRLRTLDDVRAASLAPPRLTTTLLGLFAALALVITAAGIAGVIAFSVSQRTQEFGVRVALGASRADVVSMVVGEGLRLALGGLAIGLVGALVLGALLSTVLFGVGPLDAPTYLAVSSVLLCVAALACLLPALRAASIDPMTALRVVITLRARGVAYIPTAPADTWSTAPPTSRHPPSLRAQWTSDRRPDSCCPPGERMR